MGWRRPIAEAGWRKLRKIAKLLDGRGEREAHVMVTQERRMYCAEDHPAVPRS